MNGQLRGMILSSQEFTYLKFKFIYFIWTYIVAEKKMDDAFGNCKNKSARLLQADDIPSVLDLFYQQEFQEMHDYKLLNLVDLTFSAEDLG